MALNSCSGSQFIVCGAGLERRWQGPWAGHDVRVPGGIIQDRARVQQSWKTEGVSLSRGWPPKLMTVSPSPQTHQGSSHCFPNSYSTLNRRHNSPLVGFVLGTNVPTKWINLKNLMLNERSQTETINIGFQSYVEFKKQNKWAKKKKKRDNLKNRILNTKNKLVVTRGRMGYMGKISIED